MTELRALIGLGNPDPKYLKTYHNVGHLLIDYLATDSPLTNNKHFTYYRQNNLIIAKTNTFMNESGLAVANLINFFKISPANIIIIHDDADQELGKFKLVNKGGAGGHHGIESVIEHLKTDFFSRLKIGIRKSINDKPTRQQSSTFVLKKMSTEDIELIYSTAGKFLTEKLKLNDN